MRCATRLFDLSLLSLFFIARPLCHHHHHLTRLSLRGSSLIRRRSRFPFSEADTQTPALFLRKVYTETSLLSWVSVELTRASWAGRERF